MPRLFAQVYGVLRPGGRFVFPVVAPPRPGSVTHAMLLGFDTVMRVRNAVWRPPFVMYYRAVRFGDLWHGLDRTGFRVAFWPLPDFGRRRDGSPKVRLVVAERPGLNLNGRGLRGRRAQRPEADGPGRADGDPPRPCVWFSNSHPGTGWIFQPTWLGSSRDDDFV